MIRFSFRESDNGLVIICDDDGVGIADTDKEMIFERGYGKNTGFGLYLIRLILALSGFTIKETGTFGKGARFEITVPVEAYRLPPHDST
jgi:signal transduction histidine kinase